LVSIKSKSRLTRLIVRGFLALGDRTTLLLGGSILAVDRLFLSSTLARGFLRRVGTLLAVLLLRSASLLLGSGLGRGTVGAHLKLAADLSPGIRGRARVAHAGEGSQLLVVDLKSVSDKYLEIKLTTSCLIKTYLRWTGLEGLHSPSEHL
jgi:hypothetical protein